MLMKVVSRSTIIATIMAVAFASISAASAFAASSTGSGKSQTNIAVSQNEVRDVKADSAFLTDLQKHSAKLLTKASDRSQEQRWLQKYDLALAEAQAVIAGHFTFTSVPAKNATSSSSTSGSSATASKTLTVGKYYQNNPDKLLALYLHLMRELRIKLGMSV